MAYTNDMQTLADISGSGGAAMQAGIQNDAANEAEQIKNQVAAGQAPAEIAKPGLANMFTQAQTTNENAIGQQNQQSADIGKQTMGTTIGAKNLANTTAMTGDQAKNLQTFGTVAGQVAGMLDSVPEAARPAAMSKIAEHFGIDLSTMPQEIQSGNPDILRGVSQKAIQASASYQEELLKGGQRNATAVETTNILAGSRRDVADTNADARKYTADRAAQTKIALQKVDNIVAQLMQKQAAGTLTAQEATTLNQAREAQVVAKSNPYVNALINPTAAGGSNGAPVTQPSQAQPQPAPSAPATQEAAKQKFGEYDESKYTYVQAVNPKTGQMDLGRIPK